MNATYREINLVASDLESTSYQLKTTAESLSSQVSEAAASLQETVASLEEMNSLVQLNSDRAKEGHGLSNRNRDNVVKGSEMMNKLQHQMSEIKNEAQSIKSVISIIDDIAFQTNLLALNAAVEAARAGELGRGFAVVAEAIRSLAQKSSQSVKEIEVLIMNTTTKVESGYDIATHVNNAFTELSQGVLKASDLNTELSASSEEQSSGIKQISSAMNTIDQSVQSNAASSEKLAASSEQLTNNLRILKSNLDSLANWMGLSSHTPTSKTWDHKKTVTVNKYVKSSKPPKEPKKSSSSTAKSVEAPKNHLITSKPQVGAIDPFWGEAIEKIQSEKAS